MSTITNNWLDQAKVKLECGNGTFSSFEFRHIKLGIAIEDLLERDATILDSPIGLNSFTLGWIYSKIQCGVMLDGNMIAQAEVIVANNNLSLTTGVVTRVTAAGTVYTLTATQAAVDFGTTDPSITLPAGRYLISARMQTALVGASFAAMRAITAKLRRTNNTAGDLDNSTSSSIVPITTTLSEVGPSVIIPSVYYETENDNDIISLYSAISVLPTAGSVTVTGAKVIAVRI